MAMKLDVRKAFDRVKRDFLTNTLATFGSCQKWRSQIYQCIATTSISFKLNSSPTENIKPESAIQQGDHLSPFLYIISTKVIPRLLTRGEKNGDIHVIKISQSVSLLPHILFTDDSLVFCRANLVETRNLKDVLNTFSRVPRNKFHKFGIYFNTNTHPKHKRKVKRILKIRECITTNKYLPPTLCLAENPQITSTGSQLESYSIWKGEEPNFYLKSRSSGSSVISAVPTHIL